MAPTSQRFVVGGCVKSERFSLSEFNALNISTKTSVDMAIVLGRRSLKTSHSVPSHCDACVSWSHVKFGPSGLDKYHQPKEPTVAKPT